MEHALCLIAEIGLYIFIFLLPFILITLVIEFTTVSKYPWTSKMLLSLGLINLCALMIPILCMAIILVRSILI